MSSWYMSLSVCLPHALAALNSPSLGAERELGWMFNSTLKQVGRQHYFFSFLLDSQRSDLEA